MIDENGTEFTTSMSIAMARLAAATNEAKDSLAAFSETKDECQPNNTNGIRAAVIPTLQRRARAHRRKRNKRC